MTKQHQQLSEIYEGSEPYLFISYSHRDNNILSHVKTVLNENNIRYWYDDGLHSGDDWNLIIANHLQNAAVCLLLLSANSAESEYVKNELNFAMNHRIPIHTLLVNKFTLPPDIEMMTGRIQMIEMKGNYKEKILKSIPTEVFYSNLNSKQCQHQHPIFQINSELYSRQGTKTYIGKHKTLNYKCIIQLDSIRPSDTYDAQVLSTFASNIFHDLFPKIYDVKIQNHQIWTYQEFRNEIFLDQYLQSNQLTEDQIINWTLSIVDGMEYLFNQNLALRDFARGSIVVVNNQQIGIFRLQNLYYGLIKLQEETKNYYFERVLQEIAILLAELCLGIVPKLPLRIIQSKNYNKHFLDTINIVIQKCTKENGKTQYVNFSQLKKDLCSSKKTLSNKLFLYKRKKKLNEYDRIIKQRNEIFTTNNCFSPNTNTNDYPTIHRTLEEEFGFEETVILQNDSEDTITPFTFNQNASTIKILICSSGQIMEFFKNSILIGKDKSRCDMVWTQPYVSRIHARINKLSDNTYTITDLETTNGTYITNSEQKTPYKLPSKTEVKIHSATIIYIGESCFKIL